MKHHDQANDFDGSKKNSRRRLNNHNVRRMSGRSYKGKRKVNLLFFFLSLVCFSSIGVVGN